MTKILNHEPRVAAVILAAGRSTRMGQAKQLLPLGESTVLETAIANVRHSAVEETVVVLGAAADLIRPHLSDMKSVFNPRYEQGMASSLRAGISALSPQMTAALIVLGDQPFVRPETLNQLITRHREATEHIVIPVHQGRRGNPVLIPRRFFPEVMELEGDTGCRVLFDRYPQAVWMVEVEDEGILLDIDSQEDYRRLSASH
jgi:molybdenum cofactor cytidylyltransferase